MGIGKKNQTPPKKKILHQTPKKRGFKREGSKEKRFFIKIPQKNKEFKNKEFKNKGFKIRNPLKREFKNKGFKKIKPLQKKRKASKETPKKRGLKKGVPQRVQCELLVSEHVIQIHAIEPAVFEFSPHERIVIGVDGGDFKP